MNLNDIASKYIDSAEKAFRNMKVLDLHQPFDPARVRKVTELAKTYMEDAKYYREKRKFHVSLTSIAYSEGLLDALRMLGAVSFEWPTTRERTNRSGE